MFSLSECFKSGACSEPRQTSKMDLFAKTTHSFKPLNSPILDVRLSFEYSSADSKPLLTFSNAKQLNYLPVKLHWHLPKIDNSNAL